MKTSRLALIICLTVVGKQDGKIIIREAGFPVKDKSVDASRLQIMR